MARLLVLSFLVVVAVALATATPSLMPTAVPSARPSSAPSGVPTTASPSASPTTAKPTTAAPTTALPTIAPTVQAPPTSAPTDAPTPLPTAEPTATPSTTAPTTATPTSTPTEWPTAYAPTQPPTHVPTTGAPRVITLLPEVTVPVDGGNTSDPIPLSIATAPESTHVPGYSITITNIGVSPGNFSVRPLAANELLDVGCDFAPGVAVLVAMNVSATFGPNTSLNTGGGGVAGISLTMPSLHYAINAAGRSVSLCTENASAWVDASATCSAFSGSFIYGIQDVSSPPGYLRFAACKMGVYAVTENSSSISTTCPAGTFGCDCSSASSTIDSPSTFVPVLCTGCALWAMAMLCGAPFLGFIPRCCRPRHSNEKRKGASSSTTLCSRWSLEVFYLVALVVGAVLIATALFSLRPTYGGSVTLLPVHAAAFAIGCCILLYSPFVHLTHTTKSTGVRPLIVAVSVAIGITVALAWQFGYATPAMSVYWPRFVVLPAVCVSVPVWLVYRKRGRRVLLLEDSIYISCAAEIIAFAWAFAQTPCDSTFSADLSAYRLIG